jgi:hypothetical protein
VGVTKPVKSLAMEGLIEESIAARGVEIWDR